MTGLLLGVAIALLLYAAFIAVLFVAGRRAEARALVRLIPDCIVLFRRLLGDPRVSRPRKVLLAAVIGYLALPVDLVPDFIPVAGQLDDAFVVALALRSVLKDAGPAVVEAQWPGPDETLRLVLRLV